MTASRTPKRTFRELDVVSHICSSPSPALMQTLLHKRRNSLPNSNNVGNAVADKSQAIGDTLAAIAARLRRRRLLMKARQPSALRNQHNADDMADSYDQDVVEYALVISGFNVLHRNQVRQTVSRPLFSKVKPNNFPQLQKQFQKRTKFVWWYDLPPAETDLIKKKYDIALPFIKVLFTNEDNRQKVRNSAKAFSIGGKQIDIHIYTPRKKASAAPPSSPANISGSIQNLTMRQPSNQPDLAPQQDSDVVMNDAPLPRDQEEMSTETKGHVMAAPHSFTLPSRPKSI
ncbi:hypothetical protein N431DRAFT_440146 [Stipitochalara longipes BDJ]|nr:hypothetical protein N431DRAFT_440146 [Stipitochalara longipes BDJ]